MKTKGSGAFHSWRGYRSHEENRKREEIEFITSGAGEEKNCCNKLLLFGQRTGKKRLNLSPLFPEIGRRSCGHHRQLRTNSAEEGGRLQLSELSFHRQEKKRRGRVLLGQPLPEGESCRLSHCRSSNSEKKYPLLRKAFMRGDGKEGGFF